ncbi:MAG: hypothetical protein ABL982_01935 [Vicinamibacterales bacterium]
MIRDLRKTRLVQIVALTMQLCMAWLSVSALTHSEDDDAVCNPVVVLHDHAAHHIGIDRDAAQEADHCFICHNLSLRSLVSATGASVPAVDAHELASRSIVVDDVLLVARRPARAPPLA